MYVHTRKLKFRKLTIFTELNLILEIAKNVSALHAMRIRYSIVIGIIYIALY